MMSFIVLAYFVLEDLERLVVVLWNASHLKNIIERSADEFIRTENHKSMLQQTHFFNPISNTLHSR